MADHDGQKLTPREMVRAHAYPVLAALSTISLVVIAVSIVPIARQADDINQCVTMAKDKGMPQAVSVRFCQGG